MVNDVFYGGSVVSVMRENECDKGTVSVVDSHAFGEEDNNAPFWDLVSDDVV